MKLKNKKTGQLGNFIINKDHFECVDLDYVPEYRNLAELNEEWEDVLEEPKTYWYIYADTVMHAKWDDCLGEKFKKIGNYFETKEEAEKALKKLKAYKRLKDNGMMKYSFKREKGGIDLDFYTLTILAPRDKDALDLLFGGDDEQD